VVLNNQLRVFMFYSGIIQDNSLLGCDTALLCSRKQYSATSGNNGILTLSGIIQIVALRVELTCFVHKCQDFSGNCSIHLQGTVFL